MGAPCKLGGIAQPDPASVDARPRLTFSAGPAHESKERARRHAHLTRRIIGRTQVAARRRGALIGCGVEDNEIAAESEPENRGTRIADVLARELHGAFEQ